MKRLSLVAVLLLSLSLVTVASAAPVQQTSVFYVGSLQGTAHAYPSFQSDSLYVLMESSDPVAGLIGFFTYQYPAGITEKTANWGDTAFIDTGNGLGEQTLNSAVMCWVDDEYWETLPCDTTFPQFDIERVSIKDSPADNRNNLTSPGLGNQGELYLGQDYWATTGSETWADVRVIYYGDPNNLIIAGSGEIVRPVQSIQTRSHTEITDEETGAFLSASVIETEPNARVYAVHDGTVTNVSNVANGYGVRIDLANPGGATSIYSNLSQSYVSPGDEVEAGCLLGFVGGPLISEDASSGEITFSLQDGETGELIDWTDFPEPTGNKACGSGFKTDHCLNNNPQLIENGTLWAPILDATLQGPNVYADQVELLPHTGIKQTITGIAEGTYSLTIAVSLVSTTHAELDITFGNQNTTPLAIDGIPGRVQVYELTVLAEDPDIVWLGDAFELSIYSPYVVNGKVRITFVCLHEGDVLIPPPPCYFDDPYFESDNAWTLGADAELYRYVSLWNTIEEQWRLYLNYGEDAYAYEDVSIGGNQATAETYKLTLVSGLQIDSPTDLFQTDPVYVDIYIDDNTLGMVSLGSVEIKNNMYVFLQNTMEFDVPADTTYEGDFYIHADYAGWPVYNDRVEITKACLEPLDGTWPLPGGLEDEDWDYPYPQPGTDTGTGTDPAIDPIIEPIVSGLPGAVVAPGTPTECPMPTSVSPIAWIAWLQCNIAKFNGSIITPLLTGLVSIIQDVLALLWGLGRWLWLTLGRILHFLLSLAWYGARLMAYWIGGLLRDIITGLFNLDFLKWIWDALSLGRLGLQLLWTIISVIWNLITSLFKAILAITQFIYRFFVALMAAINATETGSTIDLSNCTSPADPYHNLCVFFMMIDYVMEDIPILMALGYIASGVLGIRLIMTSLKEFGSASGQVG